MKVDLKELELRRLLHHFGNHLERNERGLKMSDEYFVNDTDASSHFTTLLHSMSDFLSGGNSKDDMVSQKPFSLLIYYSCRRWMSSFLQTSS